jgi:hypothetical protein
MSVTDSGKFNAVVNELRNWPRSERLRLARMILETLEPHQASAPPRQGSLKDLLGILKTDAPVPTAEECRVVLEEELIKEHLPAASG